MKIIFLLINIVGFSFVSFAGTWKQRGGLIKPSGEIKKKNWLDLADSHKQSIKEIINVIETSKAGLKLIAKARLKARMEDKSLLDVIQVGDVSITDTTLVRRFSPSRPGEIKYSTKSIVYIDRSLSAKNAVLDLSHELTHYVYKKPFNPYKEDFELSVFMYDTIEAEGGEVDAFLKECEIALDIFGKSMLSGQCQEVFNGEGFSRAKSVEEFYKLGLHYNEFVEKSDKLKLNTSRLPISSRNSTLISSAWGVPYPLSVIEEFETIMGKVCRNDKKRLTYFDSNKGRFPASAPSRITKLYNDYHRRCKNFTE